MTTTTIDTSPAAVDLRRRQRIHAAQDRALDLHQAGIRNRDIGIDLGISTAQVAPRISVAHQRQKAVEQSHGALDLGGFVPTTPEKALLHALLKTQVALWADNAVRSPQSKSVSWRARHSSGWAAATARRRISGDHFDSKGSIVVTNGPRLIQVAGNGYMSLTAQGWALCRTLFPDDFDFERAA